MNFDINVAAGLVAGVAAMVPGSIVYAPSVLGRRWMKEIGVTEKELKAQGGQGQAIGMMLLASLINGLVASTFVVTINASGVGEALEVCLLLSWFLIGASMMLVFFERRSTAWFGITALNHLLTFAVIGIVLGLMI